MQSATTVQERESTRITLDNQSSEIVLPQNTTGIFHLLMNKNIRTITIGANSMCTIIEEHSHTAEGLMIEVGENAVVHWNEQYILNNTEKSTRRIHCKPKSSFTRTILCTSSTNQQTDVHLHENAVFHEAALSFGKGKDTCTRETKVIHEGQKSSAIVMARTVLIDNATGVSKGMLRIEKSAQHSTTTFNSKVLLLSTHAQAEVIPSLEIEADEVQAHHAASVSQIDGEQLFYGMSRGLSEEHSRKLIVQGFFNAILTNLSPEIQQQWEHTFEEQWQHSMLQK